MKIVAKLTVHPKTKYLGYYRDGKFIKILTRSEYEKMETDSRFLIEKIIKGGEKSGNSFN